MIKESISTFSENKTSNSIHFLNEQRFEQNEPTKYMKYKASEIKYEIKPGSIRLHNDIIKINSLTYSNDKILCTIKNNTDQDINKSDIAIEASLTHEKIGKLNILISMMTINLFANKLNLKINDNTPEEILLIVAETIISDNIISYLPSEFRYIGCHILVGLDNREQYSLESILTQKNTQEKCSIFWNINSLSSLSHTLFKKFEQQHLINIQSELHLIEESGIDSYISSDLAPGDLIVTPSEDTNEPANFVFLKMLQISANSDKKNIDSLTFLQLKPQELTNSIYSPAGEMTLHQLLNSDSSNILEKKRKSINTYLVQLNAKNIAIAKKTHYKNKKCFNIIR